MRSNLKTLQKHLFGNLTNFPLRSVAATVCKKVLQASCIESADNFCCRCIRKNKSCVLIGFLDESIAGLFVISLVGIDNFFIRSAVLIGTFLVDVTDSKCISDFLVSDSLNLESLFIGGKSLFVLCNLGRSYKVKPCAVNISL